MQLPLVTLERVLHLGDLDPSSKGRNWAESYEGGSLSVSLCPQAWESIARLGGSDLHELRRTGASFVDLTAALHDEDFVHAATAWAIEGELASRTTSWRLWEWDCEQEDWRYCDFATREDAEDEADEESVDYDGNEAPEGHDRIEEIATLQAGPDLARSSRLPTPRDADAKEPVVAAFAVHLAREAGCRIAGYWWNEDYAPEALSAPRGCIFPEEVRHWTATTLDEEVDDLDELDAMPETVWVDPTLSVPRPVGA